MTNFLISSKSQTSLITNTKCTLEKTWIVNTADIYAEPPQRQKNFRLKKFLFESFAFKNQKKIKIFMSKFSFSSHARIFGTFGDFEIVKSEFMFHFMTFYAFLSVYVSVISMSFLIFSLYFFLGQTWNALNLPSGHVSWLWLDVSFERGVYPWGNLKSINIWRNFRIPGATIL